MVKTLQKKFITISMVSTALVLFLMIGGINIFNYLQMMKTINARLAVLTENKGTLPVEKFYPKPDKKDSPRPSEPNSFRFQKVTKEMPFDTRYFTVQLSSAGEVLFTDTSHIAAITADDAGQYASTLFSRRKMSGFIDQYRYQAIETETTLYIFLDCEREQNMVRNFFLTSLIISLLGLTLVFLLILLCSKRVTKPIAESYEKQKHFITDASHEIKTPLTIIDANTEILEMEHGENEWTQSIRKQIKRLTKLTEKLVFLARMDEENAALSMMDFSLSDAMLDVAQSFETVARAKGLSICTDIENDVILHGDEERIRQMLSLLLDNAMKYACKGEVLYQLKTHGRFKHLTITNQVEGMSAGRHDELLERFYRPDNSRSRATGGHGIGLSVVAAIVNAHKGKISVKCDGEKISFYITLL